VVDKETGQADEAPKHTPFAHLRAYMTEPVELWYTGAIVGQLDAEWDEWEQIERGPVRQAVRILGRVGIHPVSMEIRLPAGEKRMEVAVAVDWQGMDGFLSLHLPLPAGGELWGGIPYGAERKELEREPYVGFERLRPGMFWAQGFVDWTDSARGIAYLPHNGDVYYTFERGQSVLQHALLNSYPRPNATWEEGINRQVKGIGRHSWTTSVLWHAGDWRTAQLWRTAQSLTTPALAVRRQKGSGTLPAFHSLLRVEPANVHLAACYREGETLLVRVFETAGQATEATLALQTPAREVASVSLLGEPLPAADGGERPALSADGRRITCALRPWQIQTLALLAGQARACAAIRCCVDPLRMGIVN